MKYLKKYSDKVFLLLLLSFKTRCDCNVVIWRHFQSKAEFESTAVLVIRNQRPLPFGKNVPEITTCVIEVFKIKQSTFSNGELKAYYSRRIDTTIYNITYL